MKMWFAFLYSRLITLGGFGKTHIEVKWNLTLRYALFDRIRVGKIGHKID